jgi:hypothetical protein
VVVDWRPSNRFLDSDLNRVRAEAGVLQCCCLSRSHWIRFTASAALEDRSAMSEEQSVKAEKGVVG